MVHVFLIFNIKLTIFKFTIKTYIIIINLVVNYTIKNYIKFDDYGVEAWKMK